MIAAAQRPTDILAAAERLGAAVRQIEQALVGMVPRLKQTAEIVQAAYGRPVLKRPQAGETAATVEG
ncbi:hypothetical protein AB0A05_26990 [Streptomyces sp. NPDC046374]|uniref:hypothetical protein n=1 Tax=Streptomyces sp. NPDC046374 TaxID=3154917 RepID=UPI0033D9FF12